MADAEKGGIRRKQGAGNNHDEDAAAAKLWAVYVSEAEKYDRSLVETWKSDMEGLLIFVGNLNFQIASVLTRVMQAALFSAILTAFLVESYKSLTPDPGDLTVHILGQISQQLAASATGSTIELAPIPHFTPTPTSIVCNALWFISLGFSLACALIATLVQQWSRNFIHKADMRSAPIIRARIFSYLYYGLKRFQMHAVVEVIPLLLHASLLFFFCGLVAFLIPVNVTMTVVAATILAIVVAAYSSLTLLPLRYLDCPYQTPLSGTFWRILQFFRRLWRRHRSPTTGPFGSHKEAVLASLLPTDETMVEAMFRAAMKSSDKRSERDYKALVWTTKSLSDEVELEPFVEAIPDLLRGPKYGCIAYEEHIKGLLRDPELQLLRRIKSLLDSCHAGILSADASQRRQITCYKALWAIATIPTLNTGSQEPTLTLDFSRIRRSAMSGQPIMPAVSAYTTSANALMAMSTFLAVQNQLVKLRDYLVSLKSEDGSPELKQASASWQRIGRRLGTFGVPWSSGPEPANALNLRSLIEACLSHTPSYIISQFLSEATSLESPPYHWMETLSTLQLSHTVPVSGNIALQHDLLHVISTQMEQLLERLNDSTDYMKIVWIDTGISELLSLWRPTVTDCIPRAIIVFLNRRESDPGLKNVFLSDVNVEMHLWNSFPRTLIEGPFESSSQLQLTGPLRREDSFTALWRFASLGVGDHLFFSKSSDSLLPTLESTVKTLSIPETQFAHISYSIIALLKMHILHEFGSKEVSTLREAAKHHPAFPTETAVKIPDEFLAMQENDEIAASKRWILYRFKHRRVAEATLNIIAEYLEHCTSEVLPYNAVKTLDVMSTWLLLQTPIHPTHQIRLANSIHTIAIAGQFVELLDGIVSLTCWSLYAEGYKTAEQVKELRDTGSYYPWLDNPIALERIKDAFLHSVRQLSSSEGSPTTLIRVQNILQGIGSWHAEFDYGQHDRKEEETYPASDADEPLINGHEGSFKTQ
ncbi:hypothetical protein B0H19DRAFT_1310917 [Mycena capillaripes]|nr:hypothetical protein B0H19DRAFT_1310917 [Mycena capillaripes]